MSVIYAPWNSARRYEIGNLVSYLGFVYESLRANNQNHIPTDPPPAPPGTPWWGVQGGGTTGVQSITAGTGIVVSGTSVVSVSNAGTIALTAGANITLTPTVNGFGTNYAIAAAADTGVASITAGAGITSTGPASTPTLAVATGTGLTVDISNQVVNTGVLSVSTTGSGLSSTGGQNPVLSTSAVLSVGALAGTGVSFPGGQSPVYTPTYRQSYTTLNSSDNPALPDVWAGVITNSVFISQPTNIFYNINDDAVVSGVNLQVSFLTSNYGSGNTIPPLGQPNYISNVEGNRNLYLYFFLGNVSGATPVYYGVYTVGPNQTAMITPISYNGIGFMVSVMGGTVFKGIYP